MLALALRLAMGLALALMPHPLRSPKPSPRPPHTPVIHSNVAYEPSDSDCADDCGPVDDNHQDECLELCAEEK